MASPLPIDTICLAGGSIKGFAQLGALHYLAGGTATGGSSGGASGGSSGDGDTSDAQVYVDMSKVTSYVGTSVGSAIALLLVCGYRPIEIFYAMYQRVAMFDTIKKANFATEWGFISIDTLADKLCGMIDAKRADPESCLYGFPRTPTLQELQTLTLKRLTVVVTNVSKRRGEYISAATHPDMSCVRAVTLSCGLPFIFERAVYNGDYYVDGGFFNNFPMRWVCDGAETPERVLGIVAIDTPTDHIGDLYTYIERILAFQFYFVTAQNIQDAPSNAIVVTIECPGQAIFQTSMPSEAKGRLFTSGVDAARRRMAELMTRTREKGLNTSE